MDTNRIADEFRKYGVEVNNSDINVERDKEFGLLSKRYIARIPNGTIRFKNDKESFKVYRVVIDGEEKYNSATPKFIENPDVLTEELRQSLLSDVTSAKACMQKAYDEIVRGYDVDMAASFGAGLFGIGGGVVGGIIDKASDIGGITARYDFWEKAKSHMDEAEAHMDAIRKQLNVNPAKQNPKMPKLTDFGAEMILGDWWWKTAFQTDRVKENLSDSIRHLDGLISELEA